MDFDQLRPVVESIHYAFHVSDAEFDGIYERVKAAGIAYGSGPFDHKNMQINSARRGGRAFYFEDIDGHLLEVMTAQQFPEEPKLRYSARYPVYLCVNIHAIICPSSAPWRSLYVGGGKGDTGSRSAQTSVR